MPYREGARGRCYLCGRPESEHRGERQACPETMSRGEAHDDSVRVVVRVFRGGLKTPAPSGRRVPPKRPCP